MHAGWAALAVALVATMAWLGLTGFAFSDYDAEASAAFAALADGDLRGFLAQVPAYGGSFVLRAPVAWTAAALGGGEVAVYRAGSIVGLAAVAALGLVLVTRLGRAGRSAGFRVLVLTLCVANPVTLRALEIGHPEELLGGALCVGAVLAAGARRATLAAVLLGLAIATKAWGVLAIGPVLLAAGGRVRVLAIAGGVTAAVLAPIVLAGGGTALVEGARSTGSTIFQPWHLFWPLGSVEGPVLGGDGLPKAEGWRTPPAGLSPLTHPGIALLVVPLSLLWARRRPRAGADDVLALLALLLALRCVLDPWNISYYVLPCLLALLAWEVLARERLPVATLATSAATWASFEVLPGVLSPDLLFATYMAWSLPLCALLAHECFTGAGARRGYRAPGAGNVVAHAREARVPV
jgi:hypothetical protein